jgi:hypothetical protein
LIHGLAVAEQDLGFTEFADDLFGGIFSSWHLTLLPCLILALHTDQFLGDRSLLHIYKIILKIAQQAPLNERGLADGLGVIRSPRY